MLEKQILQRTVHNVNLGLELLLLAEEVVVEDGDTAVERLQQLSQIVEGIACVRRVPLQQIRVIFGLAGH